MRNSPGAFSLWDSLGLTGTHWDLGWVGWLGFSLKNWGVFLRIFQAKLKSTNLKAWDPGGIHENLIVQRDVDGGSGKQKGSEPQRRTCPKLLDLRQCLLEHQALGTLVARVS